MTSGASASGRRAHRCGHGATQALAGRTAQGRLPQEADLTQTARAIRWGRDHPLISLGGAARRPEVVGAGAAPCYVLARENAFLPVGPAHLYGKALCLLDGRLEGVSLWPPSACPPVWSEGSSLRGRPPRGHAGGSLCCAWCWRSCSAPRRPRLAPRCNPSRARIRQGRMTHWVHRPPVAGMTRERRSIRPGHATC